METISPYYVKPIHGTALKAVMEESALMDEFMAMFKKKLELDEQHLKNLAKLRASWNVKWREGNIGSLLTPILTHFEDEINHLTHAKDNLKELWKEPPVALILEPKKAREFDPFTMPGTLEELFDQCKKSHKAVSTFTGKTQLRNWYKANHWAGIFPGMSFPKIDLLYQNHVVNQQRYVEKARQWYTSDMEEIIERHQQHAEDIKKVLRASLCTLNDLLSQSLTSCSYAVHSISLFASTQFIAARHEEIEQEKEHVLLQAFDYYSYYQSDTGQRSRPIFGLRTEDTVAFIEIVLGSTKLEWEHCMKWLEHHPGIDHMLQFEHRSLQKSDMRELLKKDYHKWPGYAILYIQYALWSGSPLLQISDQEVTKYESRAKRLSNFDLGRTPQILLRRKVEPPPETSIYRRMEPITKLAYSNIPSRVAQLVSGLLDGIMSTNPTPTLKDSLAYASSLLTHSKGSYTVMKDIWQKWDFIHGCPLTVERNLDSDRKPESTSSGSPDTTKDVLMIGPQQLYGSNESASSYIGGFVDWRYRIEKIISETRYLVTPVIGDFPYRNGVSYHLEFEGVDMVSHKRIILKTMYPQRSDTSQDSSDLQPMTSSELEKRNLEKEKEAYSRLSAITPQVHYSGKYRTVQCLVMDHYGSDLSSLFRKCSYRFSIKTVAMIAKETLNLMETVHQAKMTFPHITLRNFAFRKKEKGKGVVYVSILAQMINFVCASNVQLQSIYLDSSTIGSSNTTEEVHNTIHTVLGMHLQGMIVDLEVLGYMFIYFLRGGPTQEGSQAVGHESLYTLMERTKQSRMPIEHLCDGLPGQFLTYLNEIRKPHLLSPMNQLITGTRFPDYGALRSLFQDVLESIGDSDDSVFDWDTSKNEKSADTGTSQPNGRAKEIRASTMFRKPLPALEEPPNHPCLDDIAPASDSLFHE